MLLLLLAYLGGVLTILSPCILPVLPFVFARADRPFLRSGLPLLVGMAASFALVATLAAVGGGWAVAANRVGRAIALVLFAGFALLLIFPHLSDRAMQPLVRFGERLSNRADSGGKGDGIAASLLLGVATGLLWAPCAGPILGLILTGAALSGASAGTAFLLLAYALGAATSLGLALLIGGRVFKAMKRGLGAGQAIRRVLGVLILVAVACIALGLDTRILTRVSAAQTFSLEQSLAQRLGMAGAMAPASKTTPLAVEGPLPALDGAVQWLNSPPLTREQLKGKVVLIDFWTYSCINCLRSLPHVAAWHDRYAKEGLVVIGVHAPEFAFERDPANVAKAVADLGIRYPVAIDNKLAIWRAFDNHYWPAHYLADAQGRMRYHHFGEGSDDVTEAAIRTLLAEAGAMNLGGMSETQASGRAARADFGDLQSPETYLGTVKAQRLVSPGGLRADTPAGYSVPPLSVLNQWALGGRWTATRQYSRAESAGAQIAFRFHARDLNLVLGSPSGRPIRFRVTIDGKPPGADHGVDTDASGAGAVTGHRLYQLVRQNGAIGDRTFTITFLDPGAEAYAFTFG